MKLVRVHGRIPLATTDEAFEEVVLHRLDARFAATTDWVRHDASFYRCFIAECDDALAPSARSRLRDEVGEVLGLDLAGPVRVTAQHMAVGDGADRHTDRPLVGYEAARLVAQLDTPDGGRFRVLEPDGSDGWRAWLDRPAVRNQAVALELCEASHHEVTECRTPRRTVVAHFWHRANPPHARELVHGWLAPMSFAALPAALDARIAEADAHVDPHLTGRAARVVWLLAQWDDDEGVLAGAFERAVTGASPESEPEARARFVTHLALESFDREAFEALPDRSRQWWLDGLARGALGPE